MISRLTVYCLHIAPDEHAGEGEDHSEWFSSLRAAKRRRRELIAAGQELKYGTDYRIERLEIGRGMGRKALALAILNRRGYVSSRSEVVPKYVQSTRCWVDIDDYISCSLPEGHEGEHKETP